MRPKAHMPVESRCIICKKDLRHRKKNTGNRGFPRRVKAAVLAGIMALALAMGIVPQGAGLVLAAEGTVDEDTSAAYEQAFGENNSTEYAGRVWTDKTVYSGDGQFSLQGGEVFTVENDSDFLVAYSALSRTQTVREQTKAPVDVIFVIDLSGSMTGQMDNRKSRINNTVQALNKSIEKVMELNPNTRVGVVGFSSTSDILLPLDHYTRNKTAEYFRLTGESTGTPTLRYEAVGSNNAVRTGSRDVTGGTNIQRGMYEGMRPLSTAASTTVTIEGKEAQRIPSVILLSDGAPTFSSDSASWWAPANNYNQGPGNSPYAGNGMKAMMTASYMKAEINRHYGIATGNSKTTVYTVGMGITGLTGDERALADITLNPSAYWDSKNNISQTIKSKWEAYAMGGTPAVDVNRRETYTLNHPGNNDITSIKDYVDTYYDADDSDSVADVFDKIVEDIALAVPEVPTELTGSDPANDGFLTYTDPIGTYMEVKDVKALLYGGKEYLSKNVSTSGSTATYSFEGTITSEVYGEQSIGLIQIKVTTEADGQQTLTVKIPAAAIPMQVNNVVLNGDGSVKSNTGKDAFPLRVLYTVGMREDVQKDGIVSAEKISGDYTETHSNEDGTLNFYSNLYTGTNAVNGEAAGNAMVEFEPSDTNPFYYNQEDLNIFTDAECTQPAGAGSDLTDGGTYYIRQTHYAGNKVINTAETYTGAQLINAGVRKADGQWVLEKGALLTANIAASQNAKEENHTATAASSSALTFSYKEESQELKTGTCVNYLGNNGVLNLKTDKKPENAVLPGGTYLKVAKKLAGRDWQAADAFTFTLKAADTVTTEAVKAQTVMLPENAAGITLTASQKEMAFGDILFHKEGIYRFLIGETAGNTPGIDYDAHTVEITVVVTDSHKGKLVAAVSSVTGSMTFQNGYEPMPVMAALRGTKVMSGRDLTNTDKFRFTIEKAGDSAVNTPLPAETTVENGADGTIAFAPMIYTKAGEYKYMITETGGSAAGVTNDGGQVEATVLVTYDAATGMLTSGVTYEQAGASETTGFTFTNVYEADPTDPVAGFTAVKTVLSDEESGYVMREGEFSFRLLPAAGNPAGDPLEEMTVGNDADGNVIFAENVRYTEPGTYVYDIRELVGGIAGIIYDDAVYTVTVVVTDGGTGILTAQVVLEQDGEAAEGISFVNRFDPTGTTAVLRGEKILEGKPLEEGEFRFSLSGEEGAPMPEVSEVSNTAAGTFTFPAITYKAEGTYHYVIREVNEGETGYIYDDSRRPVTVTVTADENRNYSAVVTGLEEVVFENSYTPEPVTLQGDTALQGTKTLSGRALKAGEFVFRLTDGEGTLVSETSNQEDGSFRMEPLTFDKTGEYYYTIAEKDTGLGGVSYDGTAVTVKITVTDSGGYLTAEVRYLKGQEPVESAMFSNAYQAQRAELQLAAVKKLTGRSLTDGEFTFLLTDENGQIISEAVNDTQGTVMFETLSYEEAGIYHYTLSEEKGTAKNVTYDEAVYQVTVTVTDNLEGALTAVIDYGEVFPVFTNSYKAPVTPTTPTKPTTPAKPATPTKPTTPAGTVQTARTGDEFFALGFVIMGIAGLAAGLTLFRAVRKQRGKKAEQ